MKLSCARRSFLGAGLFAGLVPACASEPPQDSRVGQKSQALFSNGGFESGTLAGWTPTTNCAGACDTCHAQGRVGTCTPAPAGAPWNPSCSPYARGGASAACPTSCKASAACGVGSFCESGACKPPLELGRPCSSGESCASDGDCAPKAVRVDGACQKRAPSAIATAGGCGCGAGAGASGTWLAALAVAGRTRRRA
jgi:hypothetical protein